MRSACRHANQPQSGAHGRVASRRGGGAAAGGHHGLAHGLRPVHLVAQLRHRPGHRHHQLCGRGKPAHLGRGAAFHGHARRALRRGAHHRGRQPSRGGHERAGAIRRQRRAARRRARRERYRRHRGQPLAPRRHGQPASLRAATKSCRRHRRRGRPARSARARPGHAGGDLACRLDDCGLLHRSACAGVPTARARIPAPPRTIRAHRTVRTSRGIHADCTGRPAGRSDAARSPHEPRLLADQRHLLRLRPARVLPGHAPAGRDRAVRPARERLRAVARRAGAIQHRRQHRRGLGDTALLR